MEGYEEYLLYTLQFDPNMPEANYDYGMLLLAKKDMAGAAEHFRTSADAAPDVDKPQIELEKLGTSEERLAAADEAEGDRSRQAHSSRRASRPRSTRVG